MLLWLSTISRHTFLLSFVLLLLFSNVLYWKFISIFEEKEDLIRPAENLLCGCVFVLLLFLFVDEIIFSRQMVFGWLVNLLSICCLCGSVAVIDNNFQTGFFCLFFIVV